MNQIEQLEFKKAEFIFPKHNEKLVGNLKFASDNDVGIIKVETIVCPFFEPTAIAVAGKCCETGRNF